MSNLPDFAAYGYQVEGELGRNRAGGRITYLATATSTQQAVVIKQFQFAVASSDWSGYKAHEREIEVLRALNHPGIPRYLNSFETKDGFCMVQEYKKAPSLAVKRSFAAAEVKQIAVEVLQILVYLQSQTPPIIHRDIKPENILVDDKLNVYLVDFGFARAGDGEIAHSSMVKGTMGFMPPEQLFNRQLTLASDLYGLGATLICLLTGTKSTNIADLLDENYRIEFRNLLPKVSIRWIWWLETMVQPGIAERYPDAAAAMAALEPIYVNRTPEVRITPERLELKATQIGEKLIASVNVTNFVPDTVLQGTWELGEDSWISVSPRQFEGNAVKCEIVVETEWLRAGQLYQRELCLKSNAVPESAPMLLVLETAPVPLQRRQIPGSWLGLLFATASGGTLMGSLVQAQQLSLLVWFVLSASTIGYGVLSRVYDSQRRNTSIIKLAAACGITVVAAAIAGFTLGIAAGATFTGAGQTAITITTSIAVGMTWLLATHSIKKDFGSAIAMIISLLTAASGINLGIGLKLPSLSSFLIIAAVTGLPVLALKLSLPVIYQYRLAQYRRAEIRLIKSLN
ncbi:MAG TPA: serine/threonine protein kinase [Oscillatoriaceae cyanobacterium M33_DOE_052]|uniref:non-specific serine/threonine protein kinase n=1 Tax=Planktothricoides sp. SpSt-374 TaxID=2282167 RepID=A0A7C3ZZK2_9CYAN|nr:serine/threonine protein kinase [Oscillatoriaceae cyanobacterium M33_DOE_052]